MRDSLIFDIGCHTGQDSDFYLRKGFSVVAVEANPVLCIDLRRRFSRHLADGRFVLVEKAIAEQAGEVEFFVNLQASIWGTIREDWAKRNAAVGTESRKILVPSIQFSSLIQQFGVPYYLKIDIEGADLLCLEGLFPVSDRPRFVSVEIEHRSFLRHEMNLLTTLGYTNFQIVEQGSVPNQVAPYPAKEGTYVDYQFSHGASGLFGRELPGQWLPRRAFITQYYRLLARNRLLGLSKKIPIVRGLGSRYSISWYDMHAALKVDAFDTQDQAP
jgi:FkbM family methyltransferase